MKVLFVCHRFPFPPTRGGKIRPFNIIRHLGQRHQVTVASLARSTEEAAAGRGLAAYCTKIIMVTVSAAAAVSRMVLRLPTPTPSSIGYFHSPALARHIRREVATTTFDLIFVHCAFAAPYVAWVAGPRKILDFGDMDSQKWRAYASLKGFPVSLGYRLEALKLRRAEARLTRRFDLCTCTTRSELETLERYRPAPSLGWFPNGVDTEYFKPHSTPYNPDSLCFVGRMDYFPNQECMIEFCHNTLPVLRARRPSITLTIVGAAPSRAVRKLGDIPGVTVTGAVPDVRPYLQASAVSIAPLRIARGTQNKVLESMAMGVPTVASVAAARGVDAEPGRHLLTASTAGEYITAILRLLDDGAERQRLSIDGRARVLERHSWDHAMRQLDRLVESCMTDRPSGNAPASSSLTLETGR